MSVTFLCAEKTIFFLSKTLLQTDHKHNHINILDFITLITTLLYNTNINSFGAPVKILQQLQKCQVENADLLRVAYISAGIHTYIIQFLRINKVLLYCIALY